MRYTDTESNDTNNKISKEITKCSIITIVVLFVTLVLSSVSLGKIVQTWNKSDSRVLNIVDETIQKIINNQDIYNIIPKRYSVDPNFWIPPTNQASRGTCWVFATLFMLESQYRENGIRKGFLKPNEYVSLSKQAYGAWLGETCLKHPEEKICRHGAYGKYNNTEDHLVDAIYYFAKSFPELKHSVLPESVCPYYNTTSESTDFKCDGMYEAIEKNPFEFSIKSYDYAVSVNETKKLLVKKQRPLGIGIGILETVYYAPCNSSSYSTSDQCVNQKTLCPEGYKSKYCHEVVVENRNSDGVFTNVNDFNRSKFMGAHEMNIVGYNDDWLYLSRFTTSKSLDNLKGGFILHNSWRSQGHSVEYLMGRRSEENEAVICPNHANPNSWIPGDRECLLNSNGDMSKCPTSTKIVRGKGIANLPDLLKCKSDEYCNKNHKYVLTSLDPEFTVNHLFSGLDLVHMIEFDENGQGTLISFDKLPYHALNYAFEPVDLVPNNELDCGYYIYPYDAVAAVQRHDWSLLDYFHTSDLEFEFPDSAYAANKASGKDYKLLEESTHVWEKTPFDGPLPYNYVY